MRLLLLQDTNQVLLVARLEILKLRLEVGIVEAGKVLVFCTCVVLGACWSSSFGKAADVFSLGTPSNVLNVVAVQMLMLRIVSIGTLTALALHNALEAELVAYDSRRHLLDQMCVLV